MVETHNGPTRTLTRELTRAVKLAPTLPTSLPTRSPHPAAPGPDPSFSLWPVAWAFSFLFSVVSVLLLINMLIAMMTKTFDNVWEASEINHQFLFARLVCLPCSPPHSPLHLGSMSATGSSPRACAAAARPESPSRLDCTRPLEWIRCSPSCSSLPSRRPSRACACPCCCSGG